MDYLEECLQYLLSDFRVFHVFSHYMAFRVFLNFRELYKFYTYDSSLAGRKFYIPGKTPVDISVCRKLHGERSAFIREPRQLNSSSPRTFHPKSKRGEKRTRFPSTYRASRQSFQKSNQRTFRYQMLIDYNTIYFPMPCRLLHDQINSSRLISNSPSRFMTEIKE